MSSLIIIFAGAHGKERIEKRRMMVVYSALLAAVLVVGAPWWLLRMATSGRYRAGLMGRFGLGEVPVVLREVVHGKRVVWVHAVSVGEAMAAARLVAELRQRMPEVVVAVSTTTETGQRVARERMGKLVAGVFYMPLDFAFSVRRYLDVLKPELMVLMESELWPRLLVECRRRGVPVAVVNARVSDRSFPRYMKLRDLWRPLLERVTVFLAQSEETADRLRRIGAPANRVMVTGNLKYDVRASAEGNAMTAMFARSLAQGVQVLVCGSTLDGEEKMLLEAWLRVLTATPNAVMVLGVRHPQRFEAVARLVDESGFRLVRATTLRAAVGRGEEQRIELGDVFLLDTIGDLASIYSLARVAFVGGSLLPSGGHNPLEPAQFGVPVVTGPSFENFREIVEKMLAEDAICVTEPAMLSQVLCRLMENGEETRSMGERGRRVFEAQAGATQRTVDVLMELLLRTGERR